MTKKNSVGEVLKYLSRYYKFELNELTGRFYYQRRDGKSKKKLFDRAYFVRLLSEGKFRYGAGTVREALKSIYYQPLNPVKEVFVPAAYLKKNASPFDKLEGYFTVKGDPPMPLGKALEMHLVRAVRCVLDGRPNRFIFALISVDEYVGKTEFIEWLFPAELRDYCMSTLSGAREKRDTILASKLLVNIDEFSGALKSSGAQLKAMISQKTAAIWVPFKNCIEQRPRITTFFATSNIGKRPLLSSDSSNSRYIIYNVKGIDWSYKNDLDPAELWAYAIAKAHDPKYVAELTIEQVRELERYNKTFSTPKSAYKRRYTSSRGTTTAAATTAAITAFAFTPWGRSMLAAAIAALKAIFGAA